jgi:endonuclease III
VTPDGWAQEAQGGPLGGERLGDGEALRRHVARLKRFYGPLAPPPSDPFALYVWEALSSQTTPPRRDAAFAALRRIPALTPDAIRRAPRAKLEAAVVLTGSLADQRLEAIIRAAECFQMHPELRNRLRGSILCARRALRDLPQVGAGWVQRVLMRMTAHAICPREAGVARVVSRLNLLPRAIDHDASPLEGDAHRGAARPAAALMAQAFSLEVELLREAFLYVTHHAAVSCTQVDPHCVACPLAGACASALGAPIRRHEDPQAPPQAG